MKAMTRSSDFILGDVGNHLNGTDVMRLMFLKNHPGCYGEKPHEAGIEEAFIVIQAIGPS